MKDGHTVVRDPSVATVQSSIVPVNMMRESTVPPQTPRRLTTAQVLGIIAVSTLLIVFLQRHIYSSFLYHDEYTTTPDHATTTVVRTSH
jgi:hypothetical protein